MADVIDDPRAIEQVDVVASFTKGEVDMQIATAKQYPRVWNRAQDMAIQRATVDEDTASACMYALPRGGKKIEGGSVRLAEIIASAYGNLRAQARIVNTDATHVTAQGGAWDLETNFAVSIDKKRRITDKQGVRFNDDMITTTANAASAIAFRDAVFKAVPKAFWGKVYEAARKVAIGDATTLGERKFQMLQYFARLGIFEDRILSNLGVTTTDDIGPEEMEKLIGAANIIKEGQQTAEELFPPMIPAKGSLADKIKAGTNTDPAPEPAKPAAPPPDDGKATAAEIQCSELLAEWNELANGVDQPTKVAALKSAGINGVLSVKKCTDPKALEKAIENLTAAT